MKKRRLGVREAKKMVREGWDFALPGENYHFEFRGYKIPEGVVEFSIMRPGRLTYRIMPATPAAIKYLREVQKRREEYFKKYYS